MGPQALIVDYGNVLSQPQDERWFDAMASEMGTSGDHLSAAYWRHRPLYDAGIPAGEYWGRVLETLGTRGHGHPDGRLIHRLIDADVASWTRYSDDVWTLARVFRGDGGRT